MWVRLSSSASGEQTRSLPVDPNCTINYLANRRLDGQVGARFACKHKQAADISPHASVRSGMGRNSKFKRSDQTEQHRISTSTVHGCC